MMVVVLLSFGLVCAPGDACSVDLGFVPVVVRIDDTTKLRVSTDGSVLCVQPTDSGATIVHAIGGDGQTLDLSVTVSSAGDRIVRPDGTAAVPAPCRGGRINVWPSPSPSPSTGKAK